MATINGSTNVSNWTFKLEVTETATSIQNRTSTVQVKAYLGRSGSQSYLGGSYALTVNCAGQSQKQTGSISYPTYISAGNWLLLKTFTFTVSNTATPTTINISSSMSSSDFSPSSASASGNMTLTILHQNPVLGVATMVETNQKMIDLGVPDTTVVRFLSKKRITISATAYDSATLQYRLYHSGYDYDSGYQSSNIFDVDYSVHDVGMANNVTYMNQAVKDSYNSTASGFLNVLVDGNEIKPRAIMYLKPSLEKTSTKLTRKTSGGSHLTDNIGQLNVKGTIYNVNDLIGKNNKITIQYVIWKKDEDEPNYSDNLVQTTDTDGTLLTKSDTITTGIDVSDQSFSLDNYEIQGLKYTSSYNYKIRVFDTYNYDDTTGLKVLSTGVAVWSEYKDRVNFEKITIKNVNPFAYLSDEERIVGVWFGKPLYQMTIRETTNTADTRYNLSRYNINDVEELMFDETHSFVHYKASSTLGYLDGTAYESINYYISSTDYKQVYLDSTGQLTFKNNGTQEVQWTITMLYTKTID